MRPGRKKTNYAVVGLGYIAQAAILPAFANASRNSKLAALVSGDPRKLRKLKKKYDVPFVYSYEDYDACLESGEIDAVFIALPNNMHCEYTVRAAEKGIHVLCEKPMAVTEDECLQMIEAAKSNRVKLMIAYRLHFEEANLKARAIVRSGQLGAPRIFNSVFTMQVKEGDIRVQAELGGGTLYDIGIYCINAARYLFGDEPTEVFATSVWNTEQRFEEVDEMTAAVLRYPGDKIGAFTVSFGAADVSEYRVVGTRGSLTLDPAYEHASGLSYVLDVNGRKKKKSFRKRDQFAPELIYFSNCIARDREPEPSGIEGLADVQIIRALYRSARNGKPEAVHPVSDLPPHPGQDIRRPAAKKPELVHASSPHPDD